MVNTDNPFKAPMSEAQEASMRRDAKSAIAANKPERYKKLISEGHTPYIEGQKYQSELNWVMTSENPEFLQILLDADAKISSPDYSPLVDAARGGAYNNAVLLMDSGFDPTSTNKLGENVLHHTRGSSALVHEFIRRGVNPTQPDNLQITPIMGAANGGDLEALKALYKHDPDTDQRHSGRGGIMTLALRKGNDEVLKFLHEEGIADKPVNDRGEHAAEFATRIGSVKSLAVLQNLGVDIDKEGTSGKTPIEILQEAANSNSKYEKPQKIKNKIDRQMRDLIISGQTRSIELLESRGFKYTLSEKSSEYIATKLEKTHAAEQRQAKLRDAGIRMAEKMALKKETIKTAKNIKSRKSDDARG